MSQVIRISDKLYKRLEEHALGFDTPSNVIERIMDAYEGIESAPRNNSSPEASQEIEPANALEIIYHPDSEEDFKHELLVSKRAYIKLNFTNGMSEVKEWNAIRFGASSSVDGNLRSGYLRGWKKRGIYKAELALNRDEISLLSG
ncbi:hypothetical protein MMIC_P2173 [Mariprofundus micogutta]|uniref:Uncharacterized protein n=1 Tax=Mariprofundus micogutta TaxID=1921010 RepID=A0A1L8CQM4_9PROT|nr:hypothetical protein [Mariprofundus micogutta]GAV21193.1 hypothetical protein MMIC_P2173 [Mariprofundus micogutta]